MPNMSESLEHTPIKPLRRVLILSAGDVTLIDRVVALLAPWTTHTYPGRIKLVSGLLPRAYTWGAVRHWRRGRRTLPPDVAIALADHIDARGAECVALSADLRAHAAAEIAKPKVLYGMFAPDPVTGADRRHRPWKR